MSESEKTVSVKLGEQWITRLDKLAKAAGLSRHQLMRNMIQVGVNGISLASKVGLFQIGLAIRDLLDLRKKAEPGEEKPLPLRIDEKLLDKVDAFAARGGLSRHQLMRNLIHLGIDELEGASRVGVLQTSVWLRDLEEAIKKVIRNGSKAAHAVKHGDDIPGQDGGEKSA